MLSRLLNLVGLLGVSLVLLVAFYYQLVLYEIPCPLCLLQRGCFVALGIGFALNLRCGSSRAHYAMMLISALAGAGTAGRQVLAHIAPGDPGYGVDLLGLHFYSWALIAFAGAIFYVAVMLVLVLEPAEPGRGAAGKAPSLPARLTQWLFVLVVAGNLVSTLLECGFGACADNPTRYEWLSAAG